MLPPRLSQLLRWPTTPVRRTVRRLVRGMLRRWPALSGQADDLSSLVRSIPERAIVPSVSQHVVSMTLIRHAGSETFAFPLDLSPAFRTEMHFARRHVYRMANVCVGVRTGACCTEEHSFQESFGSVRRWLLSHPVAFRRKVALSLDGPVTCVNTTGYAHYLLEEVPRLLWVMQFCDEVDVLVPAPLPRYAGDILSALRLRGRLKGALLPHEESVAFVQEFVFTQAEAYSGFWHTDDIALLRSCFLPPEGEREQIAQKVYVSRLHSGRSYANEAAVETYMRSRGFEVAYLEDLRFLEQVRLFSWASVIVSPHGGGLANLAWCSPGTRVVELFTGEVFNDCFARLCSQLACSYRPVWAGDSGAPGVVDLDELERALARQDHGTTQVMPGLETGDPRGHELPGQAGEDAGARS